MIDSAARVVSRSFIVDARRRTLNRNSASGTGRFRRVASGVARDARMAAGVVESVIY
jgi:hypothetical protein